MNTQSPFTIFERCIAFLCFGWYFFLKDNDPRFNWPTATYTTRAGANTPLVRRENAWKQYAFVTTPPNQSCYVVMKVVFMGIPMCWLYTKVIPPNTRLRFGVGDKPMSVCLITPQGGTPVSESNWIELRMNYGDNGTEIWEDLTDQLVETPTNYLHL